MKIDDPQAYITATELEVIQQRLPVTGARLLELGCGRAVMTRQIVEALEPASLVATEVDHVQHINNLQISDLPTVRFVYGGAESIDLEDGSIDIVLMLKSLHHVPRELQSRALTEIARVLRPGGYAYLSEPVYAGDFNDILRLFRDEQRAREAAFEAVRQAVDSGLLTLQEQVFFNAPGYFRDFADFEERVIEVTHTDHQLDEALRQQVRDAFNAHMTNLGANFLRPSRVDLLRKPE